MGSTEALVNLSDSTRRHFSGMECCLHHDCQEVKILVIKYVNLISVGIKFVPLLRVSDIVVILLHLKVTQL